VDVGLRGERDPRDQTTTTRCGTCDVGLAILPAEPILHVGTSMTARQWGGGSDYGYCSSLSEPCNTRHASDIKQSQPAWTCRPDASSSYKARPYYSCSDLRQVDGGELSRLAEGGFVLSPDVLVQPAVGPDHAAAFTRTAGPAPLAGPSSAGDPAGDRNGLADASDLILQEDGRTPARRGRSRAPGSGLLQEAGLSLAATKELSARRRVAAPAWRRRDSMSRRLGRRRR